MKKTPCSVSFGLYDRCPHRLYRFAVLQAKVDISPIPLLLFSLCLSVRGGVKSFALKRTYAILPHVALQPPLLLRKRVFHSFAFRIRMGNAIPVSIRNEAVSAIKPQQPVFVCFPRPRRIVDVRGDLDRLITSAVVRHARCPVQRKHFSLERSAPFGTICVRRTYHEPNTVPFHRRYLGSVLLITHFHFRTRPKRISACRIVGIESILRHKAIERGSHIFFRIFLAPYAKRYAHHAGTVKSMPFQSIHRLFLFGSR